jgi:nitrite reductase (NADH) small subunit
MTATIEAKPMKLKQMNTQIKSQDWKSVCSEMDLITGSGVCVLFEGEQVAIFKDGIDGQIFAVSNYCPFSEANVISRGIIGSLNGKRVVASPVYKQHFDLFTGECLEDGSQSIKAYTVRSQDGQICLQAC